MAPGRFLALAFAGGALALDACSDESSRPPANSGDLNEGLFRYICLSEQDAAPACTGGEFPSTLAVGSRFDLDFESHAQRVGAQVISGVSARIANRNAAWFEVVASGYTSMLAISAADALDFTHLRGARVDSFTLHTSASELDIVDQVGPEIHLIAGETVELWAIPREAISNTRLAGALDYTWTFEPSELVDLSPVTASRATLITARAAGNGTLRVRAAGAETLLTLTITNGTDTTDPTDSSSSDDSFTATDTATGTTTGTITDSSTSSTGDESVSDSSASLSTSSTNESTSTSSATTSSNAVAETPRPR